MKTNNQQLKTYSNNIEMKQSVIKCYGKVILIRPYEIKKYVSYFKKVNIVLSVVIVGLYPIFLAIGLNKLIDKISFKNCWRI